MTLTEFASSLRAQRNKYECCQERLMHVEVIGHRSKRLKDLMASAVEFYCSLLMTKRMCESLEIYVFVKKKLEGNYSGLCSYVDHYRGKRTFEIELAKGFSVRETMCSLAHEVVHLKQFATGELKDTMVTANTSQWKGERIDENKIDYWDLPFEIEAYGRERGLFSRYAIKVGLDKEKRYLNSKVR